MSDYDTPAMAPCVVCEKPSSIEVVFPDSYVMTMCVSCAPKANDNTLDVIDEWGEFRDHLHRKENN